MTLTEFSKKCKELYQQAFTQEFKENKILLDVVFNDLEASDLEYYENGEILSYIADQDDNKQLLDQIIKDYSAYKEVTHLRYNTDASHGQIDLIVVIEYAEDNFKDYIRYDQDKEEFYYLTDED